MIVGKVLNEAGKIIALGFRIAFMPIALVLMPFYKKKFANEATKLGLAVDIYTKDRNMIKYECRKLTNTKYSVLVDTETDMVKEVAQRVMRNERQRNMVNVSEVK